MSTTWIKGPENNIGIHHGEASYSGPSGEVVVTIHRGGTVIAKITSLHISDSCIDGIQNYNAWVGSGERALLGIMLSAWKDLTTISRHEISSIQNN
ncbi:hypothetical protein N7447_009237 [Penicillium robsamsonii]|uniref:uncharacterized protein n=1 Tax=Penicillium robsamsonii TaxID=1792511 RepID=UPI002549A159|nr:uncharacterized protein N7447_009237 [Penicillium robsamsonii]KAJ5817004.1 hypothetical protein N7447_009237 [Penicillium robsamsonii]